MSGDDPRMRLATLAETAGDSLAALSRMLRRNPAYLQQYVKRGSPRILPEAERRLLADHFGVEETVLGAPQAQPPAVVAVPRLSVAASAGPGRTGESERRLRDVMLERSLLREAGVAAADASIIDARGDSMAPGILDGDRLLVDGADRRVDAAGGIFVVRLADDLLVKRLRRDRDALIVASDNPAYPDRTVPMIDADVRGRVKLLIRKPR
ncbi:Phage repressor protein [Sphingomonas sp. EC-HK361]|uniref:S24 family peptidase n=1 Tax=Sphingomonas sp. EC-HK361 TaxID=2038397 RepID=UPI00125AAFDA|nr:S24 family peptidase [Sphingomonas sp. EC-HK361]VVT23587.1 Phage repressor protein [Sphingomonas sp. EC-HK361]